MSLTSLDDLAYVAADLSPTDQGQRGKFNQAIAAASAAGWRRTHAISNLEVWLGPSCPWRVRQVGVRHILIGEWHGAAQSLAAVIATSRSAGELARRVCSAGWGAYLLLWRDADGRVVALRDPTGAVEAIRWRAHDINLLANHLPRSFEGLAPDDFAIDWPVVDELLRTPSLLSGRLALRGVEAITPGTAAWLDGAGPNVVAWRPGAFCRLEDDGDPAALARVIDETTAVLLAPHNRVLAELSGGLDSAIIASSLARTSHGEGTTFVNFFGDQAEGDERRYAQDAADLHGLKLQTHRKPIELIAARDLQPLGLGLRPALQGLDTAYDAGVAEQMRQTGASALLTGQGGDTVLFHTADLEIAVDRRRRRGWKGFEPAYWAALGQWTRRSAWAIGAAALQDPRPPTSTERLHPWLEDASDLPPAKHGQLVRLVNSQLFWGDCLRARSGALLHPLLSQPVVEHCLAIPADILTAGPRDRGLARVAFADRLPESIRERRSKGDLSRFYGEVIRRSLPELRELLIGGLLAGHRVLDPLALDRELTPDRLIWDTSSNRFLIAAVFEVWARHWDSRIQQIRGA